MVFAVTLARAADPLPSWNDTAPKRSITAFDRIKALAPQHPEWQEKEPFASILKGDLKNALAGGEAENCGQEI